MTDSVDARKKLADQLLAWFRASGFESSEMALDFVDIILAARRAEELLLAMSSLNPNAHENSDEIVAHIGKLHAWVIVEIGHHIEELKRSWDRLEEHYDRSGDL